VELALQILAADIDVHQRHANIAVAQQAHECRERQTRPDHRSGKSVTKLVKRRPSRTAGLKGGTSQGEMERHVPGVMGFGARQQVRGSLGLRQGCTEFQ